MKGCFRMAPQWNFKLTGRRGVISCRFRPFAQTSGRRGGGLLFGPYSPQLSGRPQSGPSFHLIRNRPLPKHRAEGAAVCPSGHTAPNSRGALRTDLSGMIYVHVRHKVATCQKTSPVIYIYISHSARTQEQIYITLCGHKSR